MGLGGIFDSIDFGSIDLSGIAMEDFDAAGGGDGIEDAIYTRPVAPTPRACCYEHAEDFARAVAVDAGHETFAFVSGGFVFGDFVEALVDLGRLSVRRMGIQTLSMSDENIDSVRNICEMQPVERLDVILSDYWYAHERKSGGLVGYLFDELDIDGMELHVAFAGTHCKVWTIETARGNHLTMHGSANLRSSGNIEQVHISPDAGLYEFCDGMAARILDAYDVVNQDARKRKSVRGRRLWQAMRGTGAERGAAEAAAEAAPGSGGRQGGPSGATTQGLPPHTGAAGKGPRATRSTATSRSEDGGA